MHIFQGQTKLLSLLLLLLLVPAAEPAGPGRAAACTADSAAPGAGG